MSIELGSIWIDNDSDLLVIVKSLEGNFEGKVKVVFNYIDRTGDGCFEASSGLDLFLNTKTKLVRSVEGDYSKGYENSVHNMEMQDSINKYLEKTDKLSLTEEEFETIIDEAFEEGYAQAYSELQAKTERERALQEKAWDYGYDQAMDDLIDAGVIGEEEYPDEDYFDEDYSDEECYSEYDFDDEDDVKEEYCFYKELERILYGEFESDIKSDKCKKEGVWKEISAKGYDFKTEENGDISGFRVTAEKDGASMGNRYDENGKLCGFFINTGEVSKGGYKLVGISGLARSGKDVAGEIILENLGEGWARGAFADIPKEMLFVMGVDTKFANKDGEDEYYQYNIRHLMQTLGTDWGRNIDNDIWIKAFKKKNPTGNFVITDVRMENEADFVRDNGGVIIHVKGRGGIKGNHQSEAGIEIKRGDLLVFNDSDLESFEKEINNICKTLVKKGIE